MGRPAKDITGVRIGYLTAVKNTGSVQTSNGLKPLWEIRCDCGNVLFRYTSAFLRGGCYSCGCKRGELITKKNKKHGLSRHPIYAVWDTMIARCHRQSHKSYPRYSSRGITVCEEWRNSFQAFADAMLPTYKVGLQLDRIDNNKGYSPDNCRWVDSIQQANNTSSNRTIATPKGVMTVKQASRIFGVKYTTLINRINQQWPQDKLFISTSYTNKVKG